MCCCLVAQPLCMIQPVISGQIKIKVTELFFLIVQYCYSFIIIVHIMTFLTALAQLSSEEDCNYSETVYGVLKRQALLCYQSQEDLESEDNPLLEIPITKVGSKQAKSDE